MCLESFPLRCQRAIDQCSAFEECVEVLNERTLVVVPPETELLVVLHVLASFPRFCTDEKTNVDNERSVPTNVKPNNVRDLPTESFSLSLSPFLLTVLSIDRATQRYLVLPRPIIIAHIEPNDVPAKVRLSTFDTDPTVLLSFARSFSLSPFSHAVLAGGRRKQKLRNEAPKLPKWPCERCVSRIALLAFSFVRVW